MPKVDQQHRDARRQQILEAAERCFADQGFHRTTMQDVLRASGLSAGAVYLYFESKYAIVRALADERHQRETDALRLALSTETTRDAGRAAIEALFGALRDPAERRRRRLNVPLWAEALRDEAIGELVRRGLDGPRSALEDAFAAAGRRGELAAGSPPALARAFVALFQGFVLQIAWDDAVDVPSFLAAVEVLLDGVLTPPGKAASGRPARKDHPPARGRAGAKAPSASAKAPSASTTPPKAKKASTQRTRGAARRGGGPPRA